MSSLRHHDKMARTKIKTKNNAKTRRTPRRKRQSEKILFVVFGLFYKI